MVTSLLLASWEGVAKALDFLVGVGERPFFLFLHFYDPHWHYAPPAELLHLFEPEPCTGRPVDLSPEQLEPLRALGYVQ